MGKYKIVNLHSAEQNTSGDGPKLPTKDQIEYGEIAVNYLKDNEKLAIRNSNDEIITFFPEKSLSDYANLNSDNTFSGTNTFNGKIKLFDTGITSSNGNSNTVWNTNGGTNYIGDYCKFMTPNNLLMNLGSLTYWKNVTREEKPHRFSYMPINSDEWCYTPVFGSYVGGTFTLSFGLTTLTSSVEQTPLIIEMYGDKNGVWTEDAEAYLNTGTLTQIFSLSTDDAIEYVTGADIQENVLYKVKDASEWGGRYFITFKEPYSNTHNFVFRFKGNTQSAHLQCPLITNSDVWSYSYDNTICTLDLVLSQRIKALEDKIAELERKLNS